MAIKNEKPSQGNENWANKTEKEELETSNQESLDAEKRQAKEEEYNKSEFLKELGIILMSEEEMSERPLATILAYQEEMKNRIHEVQAHLSPKDLEASKAIFAEALNRIEIVKDQEDLKRLKRQYGFSRKKPIEEYMADIDKSIAEGEEFERNHPDHKYYTGPTPGVAMKKKKKKK